MQFLQRLGLDQQQLAQAGQQFQQQLGETGRQFDVGTGLQRDQMAQNMQQFMARLGLDQQAQNFNQDFSNRQLGENTRQFDVGQANAMQQFLQRLGLDQQAQNFNQDFSNRQLGENTRQFDVTTGLQRDQMNLGASQFDRNFARQGALDDFNMAMQRSAQEYQRQNDESNRQNALEQTNIAAFGRKFGPNVSAM